MKRANATRPNHQPLGLILAALGLACTPPLEDLGDYDTGVPMDGLGDATGDAGDTAADSSDGTTTMEASASAGDGDGDAGNVGDPCTGPDECAGGNLCHPVYLECQYDCGAVELDIVPPNPPVMLVLDKSGSMTTNGQWSQLYDVVESSIIVPYGDRMDLGLQLFPSASACPQGESSCYNAGACVVSSAPEVAPAPGAGAQILAAMPGPTADTFGGTPARAAVDNAVATLAPLSNPPEQRPAIILVTDGAANCRAGASTGAELLEEFDGELEAVVGEAWSTHQIPTYVIGIDIVDDDTHGANPFDGTPAANPFVELNKVAVAGGRPRMDPAAPDEKFYATSDQASLEAALETIAREIVSCEINLAGTLPSLEQIPYVVFTVDGESSFVLDPAPTEQACRDGAVDGWMWLQEGELALLCGSYCEGLRDTGTVDTLYGCPYSG